MSTTTRFVVTFTAAAGPAGIHALRGLLKIAGRRFGLRAVDAREEPATPTNVADALVQLHRDVNNRLKSPRE